MHTGKNQILNELERSILPLQGYRPLNAKKNFINKLGQINHAFPGNVFPTGAVHEFVCTGNPDKASTAGFISVLLSSITDQKGAMIWIGKENNIYPPALAHFKLQPHHFLFIKPKNINDVVAIMEECLKCEGLAAVIGDVNNLDFKTSRRLQLAVEKSRTTGFVIRTNKKPPEINACVSRWKISTLKSDPGEDLPGVGFPKWKIELLKARNGKPGIWLAEWKNDQLLFDEQTGRKIFHLPGRRKTG